MAFFRIDTSHQPIIPTRSVSLPTTTSTKITYDGNGKVVASTPLVTDDIPLLPISHIIDLQTTLDSLTPTALPTGTLHDILTHNGSEWIAGDQTDIINALSLGSAAFTSSADYALQSHTHTLGGDLSGTLSTATVIGYPLTKVDDTNVTLTLGGSPTQALLDPVSLTLGWTGTLAVTRGGTGLASLSQGDMLYASAANTLSVLSKDINTTRYISNGGTSFNPIWDQINLVNGVIGTLPAHHGGTGLSALGSASQLLRVNAGATALEYFTPSYPTGSGTNTYIAYWTGSNTLGSDSDFRFDGTNIALGTSISASHRISCIGKTNWTYTDAALTTNSTGHTYTTDVTSAANNVSLYGAQITTNYNNDGTRTNNYLTSYNFGANIGNTNASTALVSASGFGGLITNYGNGTSLLYGMGARVDERATAPLANYSRYGLTADVYKFYTSDAHNAYGSQIRVDDQSGSARWNNATGITVSANNAVSIYGASIRAGNARGTGNTQRGVAITNAASGATTVVDNVYALDLNQSITGGAVITNYYGLYSNDTPAATNNYALYLSGSSWRNYINGNLALGNDNNGARLFIRGSGTTSSTYSFFVENSSGTDYLKLNDAGQLYLGSSTPNASSLFQMDSTALGFARPRMTNAQRDAISTPLEGLSIYNSTTKGNNYYNGTRWIRQTQTTGTPTITAATGYSAASATGNDLSGYITFTSAGSATTGKVVDFDFNTAFPASSTYTVILSPKDTDTAGNLLVPCFYITNIAVSGFDIEWNNAVITTLSGGAVTYIPAGTYEFYYHIIQTS